ncbi:MAG: DUF4411 family protein [Trueperaceae bacterium]|nr:DUF4411 family protein [Trueperaceae bacterium]
MTTWLLDTNVFVRSAQQEYGLDFCPGFWDWLLAANADGRVYSIQKVFAEIVPGDALAQWAAKYETPLFLSLDAGDGLMLGRVAQWARSGRFTNAAATEFLGVADSQLVAVALARKMTVVTHEVPSNSKQRIKVPTACIELGAPYSSPYEMLRRERARFVLGAHP